MLDCGVPSVLAHRADLDHQTVIAAHNLRREVTAIRLSRTDVERGDRLVGLTGSNDVAADLAVGDDTAVELDLDPYGFRWLRLRRGTTNE